MLVLEELQKESNVQYNPTKWLKGTTSLSYTHSDRDYPGQVRAGNNGFMFAQSIPEIYGPYLRDSNGDIIYNELLKENTYDFGFAHTRPFSGGMNPVGAINKDIKNMTSHNVNLVQKLTATLTEGLTMESTFGYNVRAYQYGNLSNPYYGNSAGSGSISRSDRVTASYTWNQLLRYTKSFGDHNLSGFIAHEANHYENRLIGAWNKKIVDPDVPELSNGSILGGNGYSSLSSYAIESYFGRAGYNYNDKYFLTGTFRRDGTSRFPEHKWGNFGSLAAAWVISSEDFMADSQLKYLKYKISFGFNGNQSYVKDGVTNYHPARTIYEVSSLDGDIAFVKDQIGNSALSWESVYTLNTGIEASYSTFLDFGVDFYMKTTKDLLMDMRIAPSTGIALIQVSDGQMQNYGVDFYANIKAINTADFKLTVSLNANMNRNELIKMPKMSNGDTKVFNANGLFSQVKGHSVTEYYTREWAGVDSQTGEAQWYAYYNPEDDHADGSHDYFSSYVKYVSEQGDDFSEDVIEKEKVTNYDDATSTFTGKDARPDFEGGFSLRAEYKGFTLSTQCSFGIGGYAYDYTYAELMNDGGLGTVNFHKDMLNSWKNPGDITDVPALRSGENANATKANRSSTRFLTSNSYLWLNNVRLAYDFSPELLKSVNLSGATVYVTGDNLAVFSSRKGMVPTMSYSGDSDANYAYAPVSTMTIGLKINF
jgi:TonB-linked SusC/RagA family outer membrane protein